MNKILITSLIIGIMLSLVGCESLGLGSVEKLLAVDTVELKDEDGKIWTVDNTWDYEEVYNFIWKAFNYDTLMIELQSKVEETGKAQETIQGMIYKYESDSAYYDWQIQYGNSDTSYIQMYHSRNVEDDVVIANENYSKFQYQSELAFGGQRMVIEDGTTKNFIYQSDEYPTQPQTDTELSKFHAIFNKVKSWINSDIKPFDILGQWYYIDENHKKILCDFDAHYVRNYKLYENYIIFEQISPFPVQPIGPDFARFHYYFDSVELGYSVTKTLKYNYVTETIEYIKYSGLGIFDLANWDKPTQVDIVMNFKPFDVKTYEKRINELKHFIKNN